jgi:hypothetical protein
MSEHVYEDEDWCEICGNPQKECDCEQCPGCGLWGGCECD